MVAASKEGLRRAMSKLPNPPPEIVNEEVVAAKAAAAPVNISEPVPAGLLCVAAPCIA